MILALIFDLSSMTLSSRMSYALAVKQEDTVIGLDPWQPGRCPQCSWRQGKFGPCLFEMCALHAGIAGLQDELMAERQRRVWAEQVLLSLREILGLANNADVRAAVSRLVAASMSVPDGITERSAVKQADDDQST